MDGALTHMAGHTQIPKGTCCQLRSQRAPQTRSPGAKEYGPHLKVMQQMRKSGAESNGTVKVGDLRLIGTDYTVNP